MKNFTTAKALALSLLCALPAAMSAKHYEHEYRDDESCCGTPLYPCGFSVEVHGGIAPTLWNKRDCFLLANTQNSTDAAQLTALGSLPKFSNLYKLPWDAGFRLGYGATEKIEVTFEFDYRQAKGKFGSSDNCNTCTTACDVLNLCYTTSVASQGQTNYLFYGLSKYQAYAGHVGARWYTERYFCDSVSFFLGIKVGFVHHKEITTNLSQTVVVSGVTTTTGSPYPFLGVPFYYTNTTISAGGLVGFDYCFWNRFSFVFQAEFLGQGPLRPSRDIGTTGCDSSCNVGCDTSCGTESCVNLSTAQTAKSNIVGVNFDTEVVFPILFGLKYYF